MILEFNERLLVKPWPGGGASFTFELYTNVRELPDGRMANVFSPIDVMVHSKTIAVTSEDFEKWNMDIERLGMLLTMMLEQFRTDVTLPEGKYGNITGWVGDIPIVRLDDGKRRG